MKHPLFCKWDRLFVLLLCLMAVAACGKMPSDVDPYPGRTAESYRQTYPDPSTDPDPRYAP